jgi:hypothetical protein
MNMALTYGLKILKVGWGNLPASDNLPLEVMDKCQRYTGAIIRVETGG